MLNNDIANYFVKKYKVKALAYQKAADLLKTVKLERDKCELINIFSKMLSEIYDSKDMIFFIYVRSQIEKELNIRFDYLTNFKSKLVYFIGGQCIYGQKESLVSPNDIDSRNVYINVRLANNIGYKIFKQTQELYKELIEKINEKLVEVRGIKERQISAIKFLDVTLKAFHNSRVDLNDEQKYETSGFRKR